MNNVSTQRAVAYVRVSAIMGREDIVSPEIQLESIKKHCEARGYVLVETLEDLDLSGRFWKRRQVEKAIAMIEAKEADVVVVWKLSRVSRNRRDWNIAVDRVESVGGRLESATEPMDTSTSSGRFARGMLAELAAFESERIGESWKETHARRTAKGLPNSGRPRFGYDYSREKGFTVNPVTGPILRGMYMRYISGLSMYAVAKWAQGTGTGPVAYTRHKAAEAVWTSGTLRQMLDSGFGAGLLNVKGEKLPGAQESVISEAEWSEYLSRREARRVHRRSENSGYLLSGLVVCQCGYNMSGNLKGTPREKYECNAKMGGRAHPGGHVLASVIQPVIMSWLETLAEEINDAAGKVTLPSESSSAESVALLKREIIRVSSRKDTLTNKFLDGTIPEDSYSRLVVELDENLKALEANLRASKVSEAHPVAEVVPDLLAAWPRLDMQVQRDMLRRLIGKVVVTSGRPRSHIEIVPLWELSR